VVKKVKYTLVQALRLCTGSTAHRGSRGIALLFHDHDTRRGWGVSVTPRPLFTPGKDPVPTVQETGSAPGPVWTGAESLAPLGIRSPDRPARSQSLYRLRYQSHTSLVGFQFIHWLQVRIMGVIPQLLHCWRYYDYRELQTADVFKFVFLSTFSSAVCDPLHHKSLPPLVFLHTFQCHQRRSASRKTSLFCPK